MIVENLQSVVLPFQTANPAPSQGAASATASNPQISDALSSSFAQWISYPKNLVLRTAGMDPKTLESFRAGLEANDATLFLPDETGAEVSFRDLGVDGAKGAWIIAP